MPNTYVQGTVRPDRYLTNFSQGLMLDRSQFIAGRVSTRIPVVKQADKYWVYPRGFFLRDEVERRPLGGRPPQISLRMSDDTYFAEEWALEYPIDDRVRVNTEQPANIDETATRTLTDKQMIRADRIWAQNFFKTGVWTVDVTGVASAPANGQFLQFDQAGAELLAFIDLQKDEFNLATGIMPNTLVFGTNVKRKLRLNDDIVERIKYTQIGVVTDALLSSLLEIPTIQTARAVYNSALETVAADGGVNIQYIANPNAFWMGYVEPVGSLNSQTAIGNFAWTGLIPGQGNDFGGVITRGRDDRGYTDWIHSRQAFDLKVVAPDLARFYPDAVSSE